MTQIQSLIYGMGLSLILTTASGGWASSPDAWKDLEKDVSEKCLKRFQSSAGPDVKKASILLDVMGAQTFITGLIRYQLPKSGQTVQMACTYDKSKKDVVEIYELPSLEKESSWKVLLK